MQIRASIQSDQSSAWVTLFSEDFESYQATTSCNSTGDKCVAPPHINAGFNEWPDYWEAASSAPDSYSCVAKGGCVTWGDIDMRPNTVFAVVTEQTALERRVSSLVLRISDKTSVSVHMPIESVPQSSLLRWTFKVWLSRSIDLNRNFFESMCGRGTQIEYAERHVGSSKYEKALPAWFAV